MARVMRYTEWLMPAAMTFGPVGVAIFPGDVRWSYLLAVGLVWLYVSLVFQRRRIQELTREVESMRRRPELPE